MHSHTYRSRIKKLTTQIKGLYPLLSRIPAALPRPGSQANTRGAKVDNKTAQARQEAYEAVDAKRVDRPNVAYWLEQFTDDRRRS